MLCPNCQEFMIEDARVKHDGCMEYSENGYQIIQCPCCYGWGQHIVDSQTGEKRICTLCKGIRVVKKKIIYETVENLGI